MAPLRYFVFTASEDGFGQAAWEGLASLRAEDLDAAQSELRLLLSALERNRWNVTQAARALGISRDTLRYRIDKFGLKP